MVLPEITSITIIGAGTMGHCIGQEFALAGYDVILFDLSDKILSNAMDKIRRSLVEMHEWNLVKKEQIQPTLKRLSTTTSIVEATREADLVVEAVFEKLELKQDLLRIGFCMPRSHDPGKQHFKPYAKHIG